MKNRIVAFGLMLSMSVSAFLPFAARAGEKEAKNAAIGASAVSLYLLSKKKTRTAGVAGAAGSAYLWKKYGDSRKARRKREVAREQYYRRAAARNAKSARYYRTKYQQTRRAGTATRASRTVRR